MIAQIRGTLLQILATDVIVEAAGIGYRIFIPVSAHAKLPSIGQMLLLHTSFIVREQSQALYGFLSAAERDFFEVLLGVSGIGPKTALSILGHLPLFDLQAAINNRNVLSLSKVPGIGKKTAERLIVEMRDKVSLMAVPQDSPATDGKVADAMNALVHLGYNQQTAKKALQKVLELHGEDLDLSALITAALKHV